MLTAATYTRLTEVLRHNWIFQDDQQVQEIIRSVSELHGVSPLLPSRQNPSQRVGAVISLPTGQLTPSGESYLSLFLRVVCASSLGDQKAALVSLLPEVAMQCDKLLVLPISAPLSKVQGSSLSDTDITEGTPPVESTSKCGSARAFISYASPDHARVRRVVTALTDLGVQAWMDSDGLRAGDEYLRVIVKEIKAASCFVLLHTENTVGGRTHKFLETEIDTALAEWERRGHPDGFIVPVRLAPCEIAPQLSHLHYIDVFSDEDLPKLAHTILACAGSHGIQ